MNFNPYQIWVTFDGEKEKFRFPVLPEKIKLTQGSSNETVDIAGLGEVTIMQDKPQAEVSWSSFFPCKPFSGVQYTNLLWPEEIKFKFKIWMGSKKPVHLIVTGTKINLFATIEKFDNDEEGGAVGDMNYSISFREWRNVTIRQINLDPAPQTATVPAQETRTDNTVTPQTYTVVKGDSLFKISKKALGNPSRWSEIASLNGLKSPYTIYPGDVLKLPA